MKSSARFFTFSAQPVSLRRDASLSGTHANQRQSEKLAQA
jgi:hypothetical protein